MKDKIYKILKPFIATKKSKLQLANVIDEIKTNTLTLLLDKEYYDHSAYHVNIYTEDKKLIYTSKTINTGLFYEKPIEVMNYFNKFDKIIIKYYDALGTLKEITPLYKAEFTIYPDNCFNLMFTSMNLTSNEVFIKEITLYKGSEIDIAFNTNL